jgi:hypothetical protein
MTDETRQSSLTRRAALRTLASIAGAGAALELGITQAQAAKMAQKAVSYQDTPNGDKRCDGCALFQPPDACKTVDGTISPSGYCKIWVKKSS